LDCDVAVNTGGRPSTCENSKYLKKVMTQQPFPLDCDVAVNTGGRPSTCENSKYLKKVMTQQYIAYKCQCTAAQYHLFKIFAVFDV